MGNPASKVGVEIKEEDPVAGSVPSTPILTPKYRTPEEFDPRSPSANIVRTPIQTILTPESKSSLDNSTAEENKCDTFNINLPAPKTSSFDPRSPTIEFMRTPIVLPETTKIPTKLHNKNLDNVRKTLISVTPKKISEMSRHVPPRLLASTVLIPKPENKRKSFVGVLETNLDYVETDLDEVIRKKTVSEPELRFSTPAQERRTKFFETELAKTPINILKQKNVDPMSPAVDFTRTPLQIMKKVGEIDLNENLPAVGENIIVDDDGLISTVSKNEVPKIIDITPKATEKKSKVNTVDDFDKKISSLIYTDEDAVMVSKSITTIKDSNRTPLGIRNGQPRRTVQKLKVSDRPRKSDYAVSKIPVFKDKNSVRESENIPPKEVTELRARVTKRAQWDSNNTLIL